jgi:Na+/H+-dicarboxylate symporter
MDPATRDALAAQFQDETTSRTATEATPSLIQRLVEMIPQNPIDAAARMNLLPLVISVLIFGAAVGVIREERRRIIITFFEGVNEMVMVVIQWIMKLAPYAVFILIAATIARFGLELIQRLVLYSLVVVAGFLLHGLGVLSLALRLLARTKIIRFYRGVAEACLVAFSTSSSNAALPVSMKVVVENLGISKRVSSFVLPLGATLNMNGSALYKAVTGVFVAQVYSISLGTDDYVTIIVTSTLAAIAGVGIPGSSLVTTLFVLNALGLGPHAATGIALVAGVDRFLDMIRTTLNVTGDLTCAAYIARSEGENIAQSPIPPNEGGNNKK